MVKKSLAKSWSKLWWALGVAVSLVLLFKLLEFTHHLVGVWKVKPSDIVYVNIPTGSDLDDVTNILTKKKLVENAKTFRWLAERKNYKGEKVHPGRYKLFKGMTGNDIINVLRSGRQTPARVMFTNTRFKRDLAGKISQQIEADSAELVRLLNDDDFLRPFGFDKYTSMAMLVPNTYEFYWNTDARGFLTRMEKEYRRFWDDGRKEKLKRTGFTQLEVSILASIIQEESFRTDEYPAIAGVYINRLRKPMRLQADPTVKFAIGDFGVKRILKKHLETDSPYNTYRNDGLPPGPINCPSIKAIDAVLDYENHKYLYFCARSDFSGYHDFATTLDEHLRNARKYQKALNRNQIYR